MNRLYEVMLLINNSDKVTQRGLSEKSGISLGSINAIVNNLEEQKYIKKSGSSQKGYVLTETGINMLEMYIAEAKRHRIKLEEGKDVQIIKQAVILGDEYMEDLQKPAGLITISEEDGKKTKMMDRMIELLHDKGIDDIIIVAGYKSDKYKDFAEKNKGIRIIENKRYIHTGSMYSLSLCAPYIEGDFLVLNNDLVFENRVLNYCLESDAHTTMVITSESGSGNENLVEIRDDQIFKLSTDIRAFNSLDGELVGITKISHDFYKRMIKEFENNKNPFVDYEYLLMDVAGEFKVGYIRVDDLIWQKVQNFDHVDLVRALTYSRILQREDEIMRNLLVSEIEKGLGVDKDDIISIDPAGGMTNKNYKVDVSGKDYILRVAGAGTEEMISRYNERNNARLGEVLGLNSTTVYFNEETGIKISEFIKDAETLNQTTAKREKNMRKVAHNLKKLHYSHLDFENEFNVFREIEKYEKLIEKVGGVYYDDEFPIIREKVMALEEVLEDIGKEHLTCHNDTVPENFIKGENDKMFLIDWEYSGMNDPMWDIAGHILECGFGKNEEELFKNIYFSTADNGKATADQEEKILLFKICQDYLWTLWTILKEAKNVSFGDYGEMRYSRAKKNLRRFYKKYM